MVDVGKVTVGNQSYYTDQVVESMEEYYSMRGESPGLYFGSLAETLVGPKRASKFAEADDFKTLLSGRAPGAEEPLGSSLPSRKVLGYDMVFRAPKSVSLMFALGSPMVSKSVEAAHDAAVEKAFSFIEPYICWTRAGKGGAEKVAGSGLAGVAFKHRTSRELDPLLHTHRVICGFTQRSTDGAYRSLDSKRIYQWSKVAGLVYQAELRAQMSRQLGVEWTPVKNGLADVKGVSPRAIEHFSKRRGQIREELRAIEGSSAKESQLAALRTRKSKQEAPENLEDAWRAEGAGFGLTADDIDGICGVKSELFELADVDFNAVAESLLGPDGLTSKRATFDLRDVMARTFDLVGGDVEPAHVAEFAEEFLAKSCVVVEADLSEHVATGMFRFRGTGQAVYSTPEMICTEIDLIENAVSRVDSATCQLPDFAIAQLRRPDRGKRLNDGQFEMVRQILGSGNGVDVVVGDAGTGKTFALGRAREELEGSGVRVLGAAPSHRAKDELANGAGIPSETVHALVGKIERGDFSPLTEQDRGLVLFVDEAAMVGTRHMATILEWAKKSGAKVVLVGDHKQLNSIDAGGAFGVLARELNAGRLSENMRQADPVDREIVGRLEADGAGAFELANESGRIKSFESTDDAVAQLVSDWAEDPVREDSIILASRNADIDRINAACQQIRLEAGELSPEFRTISGRAFHVGDRVVFRETNSALGFQNQDFGTVTRVHDQYEQFWVTLDRTGTEVLVGKNAFNTDRGVLHGYASTVHVAQGQTVDSVYTLLTRDMTKEHIYVAISRHRNTLQMYGAAPDVERFAGFGPDQVDDALAELSRPFTHEDRQQMAIDLAGVQVGDDLRLQAKLQAISTRLLSSPPGYIVERIGHPPASAAAREKWAKTAVAVEIQEQCRLDKQAGRVPDGAPEIEVKKLVLDEMIRDVKKLGRELSQSLRLRL